MSRFHEVFLEKLSFYNFPDGSGCEPRRIAMQPSEQKKEVDRAVFFPFFLACVCDMEMASNIKDVVAS